MNWQKLNDTETYSNLWNKFKGLFRKRNREPKSRTKLNFDYSQGLNLSTILKLMIYQWKSYFIGIIISVFIGWLIGHNTPKSYTAKVQLAPESSSEMSKFGSLGGIASQFGLDVSGESSDAIVPDLYPTVVNSTNFVVGLCGIEVTTKDGKVTTSLYDYCLNYQKNTPWGKWLTKLTKKIRSQESEDAEDSSSVLNPYKLTKSQNDNVESIKDMISCKVDQKTSVITIKANAQDPLVSAILVDSVSNHLQKFITEYRTSKARHDVEETKNLVEEARSKYTKIQKKYADYVDAHEDLDLQSYKSKRDELENEMQLRYNIYTQLQQQLQIAEAKVQEKTPVYAVIEPATVPTEKSAPHTMLLAFMLMIVYICIMTAVLIIKFNIKAMQYSSAANEISK